MASIKEKVKTKAELAKEKVDEGKNRAATVVKSNWKEDLKNQKYKDVKFHQLDMEKFNATGWKIKTIFIVKASLVLKYFLMYALDFSVVQDCYRMSQEAYQANITRPDRIGCVMSGVETVNLARQRISTNMLTMAIIYTVFLAISVILFYKEVKAAKKIVKSDDVSDVFMNMESYRYYSVRSFKHFVFFKELMKSKSKVDGLVMFVYTNTQMWKRTVFVSIPLLGLAIATMDSAYCIREEGLSTYVSILLKVIMVSISVGSLFVALVMRPFLKCYIRGNLGEYVSYRMERRINEMVEEKEALKADIEMASGDGSGSGKIEVAPQDPEQAPKVVEKDQA